MTEKVVVEIQTIDCPQEAYDMVKTRVAPHCLVELVNDEVLVTVPDARDAVDEVTAMLEDLDCFVLETN